MKCLHPFRVRKRCYDWKEPVFMDVPCGKCMACLARKRREWMFRCKQELRVCTSCYFVTLTYDEEHVPRDGFHQRILCKPDVQKFFKRLRKHVPDCNVRYFLCGEYSPEIYRPHYHALIFNLPLDKSVKHMKIYKLLKKSWQNGEVFVGDDVGGGAVNYCCKYCLTVSYTPPNLPKPFILTSRRPGLGANYVNPSTIAYHERGNSTVVCDGVPLPLPRFYKNKVQSLETREKLFDEWISHGQYEEADKEAAYLRTLSDKDAELYLYNKQAAAEAYEINQLRFLTKRKKL